MTRVCTHHTHDRTHVIMAQDFLIIIIFFLLMSDSTHTDSSSLRLHPRQIDHAHGFFLLFFFVTRSHIDQLHRSVTRVAHNQKYFLISWLHHNESIKIDQTAITHNLLPQHHTHQIMKKLRPQNPRPDFKNSRLRSSLRSILVDIFHEGWSICDLP